MKQDIKTVTINGIEYAEKCTLEPQVLEAIECKSTVAECMTGEYVMTRTRNNGISVGKCIAADDTGIVLEDSRRLWYHAPKDKTTCWYEGVVNSALSEDSSISCTIKRTVLVEDYQAILLSEKIYKEIMDKTPRAQS